MLRLVQPTVERRAAWSAAHAEWGPGLHEDGFGLTADDDPATVEGFARWLDRLRREPGTAWWIVEDDTVLGGIALRPDDHPAAARHGHVGYGVRPSARGRGVATWAVGQVRHEARAAGRLHVDIVCAVDNLASARVAEHYGGRVEAAPNVLRYRIDTCS